VTEGHAHPGAGRGEPSPGIDTVEHLVEHLAEVVVPSTALVCVGNDLCGDDGAGVAVAQRLQGNVPWAVFDTQGVPESFLMKIVDAKPEAVMIVDALDFDAAPGAVELFAAEAVTGQGPSTHGPAPIAFLDLLKMMHPCRRAILGIQPAVGEFGGDMTAEVHAAVEFVSEGFLLAARDAAG